LYTLEENGQTALGPAILFAINLIKGTCPGSRIVLCTDGIANIGLGALDLCQSQEELEVVKTFYSELGNMAKNKGIMINLITFQDEESKIEILQQRMFELNL